MQGNLSNRRDVSYSAVLAKRLEKFNPRKKPKGDETELFFNLIIKTL
jgi:hypothetical protein